MTILSWFEDYGNWDNLSYDLSNLGIDEAYLNIVNSSDANFLYKKHIECQNCPYERIDDLEQVLLLKKVPSWLYRFSSKNDDFLNATESYLCEFGSSFGEFGVYNVIIGNNCTVTTIKEPVSVSFPVLTVFLIYLTVFACIFGLKAIFQKCLSRIDSVKAPKEEKNSKPRIQSLDTFRGISIVLMIFINFGAGEYEIIDHAVWNGLHLADLVFPWFLWIMGVCIPISLSSSFKRETANIDIFLNVLKRSIKLFCLGVFLGGGTNLKCLRIFGVLQRFGISYLIATTVCIYLLRRELPATTSKWKKALQDVFKLLHVWIAALIILIAYLLVIFLVTDKDCPRGYFGPGGLHENGKYKKCVGGATGYIDKIVLGDHRYSTPTIDDVYKSGAFDPEGILGCLPSIVHVFIGVQAGMILLVHKSHQARLLRWLAWGLCCGLLGGALCGFSKNEGLIPVNKNLWSLSFVLVTSCFAFVLLSICYWLIDMKKWWTGKPFLFAGMNAILMYIGHSMTYSNFPVRWTVECWGEHPTHFFALFENIWGTGFWLAVSYYWWKIKYIFTI